MAFVFSIVVFFIDRYYAGANCPFFIAFIKLVGANPRILSFSPTHLINSIIHEHSCNIFYFLSAGWYCVGGCVC